MQYKIYLLATLFCLVTNSQAFTDPSNLIIRPISATHTFTLGEEYQIRPTCQVGETLITATWSTNGPFTVNFVVHQGSGLHGREAIVRFHRIFTEADYNQLSNGNSTGTLTSDLSAFAHCAPGINVRFYGAIGDGVADDTAAIKDAIRDTPADGTLFFPAGNYRISDELLVNKRIHIKGTGATAQIFQSAKDKNLFRVEVARGVRIESLYLGSASKNPNTGLLVLNRAHHADINHIILRGGHYGIWIKGTLSSTFTNIRSDANLAGPSYFAAAETSPSHTWVRSERDNAHKISANANVFINPLLEGGRTCFHHSDFGGNGNLNIFGGTIEGCQVVGMKIEGNGAPVNVYGTHFENNYKAFGALDVETNNSFGVQLNGIFSAGKLHFRNRGSEHSIMSSMINRLEIDADIKRTIMQGSKHSNTGPGSQIVDHSGHSYYVVNGVIQSLTSPKTTTIGLRTDGPPILGVNQDADLTIKGAAYIQDGVTP